MDYMDCIKCPLRQKINHKAETVLCMLSENEHEIPLQGCCEVYDKIIDFTKDMCNRAKLDEHQTMFKIIEKMLK